MGYDVHITRKENWFDETGEEISLAEWKSYVQQDSEMRLDNFAETKFADGNNLRVESEGLSVWVKYSGHGKNGNMAWFDYRRGDVVVKNPDDEILQKMVQISKTLHAKVQGDEGEIYPLNANPTKPAAIPDKHDNTTTMLIGFFIVFTILIIVVFFKLKK